MSARPHPLLIEFEAHAGLGPVAASRVLGLAYPTYAQIRSGRRPMQRYHEVHVRMAMALQRSALEAFIKEITNA